MTLGRIKPVDQEKILHKYVALSKFVWIHNLPNGGYVCKKRTSDEEFFSVTAHFVNRTGRDTLLKCDGTKRVIEIIEELCREHNEELSEKLLKDFLRFFKYSITRGYIRLSEDPIKTSLSTTGTFDYYIPIEAIIELTYRCPLRCKHCYVSCGPSRGESFPIDKLIPLLEDLYTYGTRIVELTGGEPTIYPILRRFSYSALKPSNGLLLPQMASE